MASFLYRLIRPVLYNCNTIVSSPADILFSQIFEGEYCHPDTLVKYMYIENHYGKNSFGKQLYLKQQQARNVDDIPEQDIYAKFDRLIDSVEENGFNTEFPIGVDKNFYLRDGSHRAAMSLYLDLDEIRVNYINMEYSRNYRYSWFCENGFSDEEIGLIRSKEAEIMDKANEPLNIVLLGSCCDEAEEAAKLLSDFGGILSVNQYYPDEVQCYNLCRELVDAADVYGDKHNARVTVNNPRFAVIKLKLTKPVMSTIENNELKIFKKFINYRLPVITQSAQIRTVLNEKTFIKDSQLFIPQNFMQNRKFEKLLNEYIL